MIKTSPERSIPGTARNISLAALGEGLDTKIHRAVGTAVYSVMEVLEVKY